MTWTSLQKSLWLLYVVENILSKSELTVTQISETFNKHFRQAKTIRPSNVSRDLGQKKIGNKALVGENTTVTPSSWYLTEEGKKFVQNLLTESKGS
jgi:hypothetical protein